MMEVYVKTKHAIVKQDGLLLEHGKDTVIWVDLLFPSSAELSYIANTYDLPIPTKEEREEIEESARFWEEDSNVMINSKFLLTANKELRDEVVTFFLHKNILITIRYVEFELFLDFKKRLFIFPSYYRSGQAILCKLFEMRVEKDADILEMTNKDTRDLRHSVFKPISNFASVLERLAILQDISMRVRDSLFDKRRIIALLLKSDKVDMEMKKKITIVLKDLNSLIEYTTVNMNMLDNIQGLFTNQINIEQNKTIKLFTVVTVAMMPPTLIASIYGMNFRYMPELSWHLGYPLALGLMVLSTIIPILYFKKKGWLL